MRDFVKRDIDRIYEKLFLVGVYLYNKQTKKWFKELKKLKSYSDFVNLSPFINNGLQKVLEKSMFLVYLAGHDSIQREIKAQLNKYGEKKLAETGSKKKTFDIQVGFDEAVRKLKLKKIIPADEFKNASTQIKQTSFSIQKIERQNALVSVKESLIRAIDTGMDFKDWKNKEMMYIFAKHGITPLNPHHLETVFRTNLGSVYETARNESAMADPNVEGWERFGIGDSRQSQICMSLDGSKYAKDDPIWESISPLSHHACRCTKIPITMAYKKANNIKWDKKPSKKTLDMVGKDFRNNPKSLKQYSNKVSKKLTDVEKKNIELNNNIKQSVISNINDAGKLLNSKISIEKGVSKTNSLEVLNTILREQKRLYGKYKNLSKLKIDEFYVSENDIGRQGAMGMYEETKRKLWIHSKSGTKRAIEMAKRRSKMKHRTSTVTDAKNIYRHELGHAVQEQLLTEKDIWSMRDEFIDVNEALLSKEVSRYAVTSPDEAFSEMFNLMVSGRKNKFKVLPKTQKIINRILK